MQQDREMGYGIRASQVRAVVDRYEGLDKVAERLGVHRKTARSWVIRLGLSVRRAPHSHQVMTAQDVLAAILSEASLHTCAAEAGVSTAALHTRARRMGLPTDRAGRAALREQRMAS